jgi:membrane protein YqaA with SNARE-associated domain
MTDPDRNHVSISQVSSSRARWLPLARRILAIVFALAISVTIFALRGKIGQLKTMGYVGAFAIMLLGNATIILPAPGLTFVFALGSALNALPVGLAAGAGGALGELTGYLAGYGGRAVIKDQSLYQRFEGWMSRYGLVTLLILAIIPNPFFDIAGVAAGALRFTWWRFLLVSWAGKTIQGILIAYAGSVSASWVLNLVH